MYPGIFGRRVCLGKSGVFEFRPQADYLKSIMDQPLEKLERLCQECSRMAEQKLFTVRRYVP